MGLPCPLTSSMDDTILGNICPSRIYTPSTAAWIETVARVSESQMPIISENGEKSLPFQAETTFPRYRSQRMSDVDGETSVGQCVRKFLIKESLSSARIVNTFSRVTRKNAQPSTRLQNSACDLSRKQTMLLLNLLHGTTPCSEMSQMIP